jgi:arabinofuranan 3-O-arabinosyltransferase
MDSSSPGGSHWLDLLEPARIVRLMLDRRARLGAAWLVAVLVAWNTFNLGWYCMSRPDRPDGNYAHVNIDFSGQYLLGRMVLQSEGPFLYRKTHQAEILKESFPVSAEAKGQETHDADEVMGWLIGYGDDSEIRGPLYPPVHALLFAPLTYLPPPYAYRVVQVLTFLLTFVVAFLAERITEERVWCPVALVLVFILPGYMGALGLGQNPLFTLTLLTVGWWLLTTHRPILAGIAWGFLAYKPVWAVAFLPVLLLTGRWRASAAMALTGIALGLATLPLVGIQCWFDWLAMGRLASDRYSWDANWIPLSRDLINLPRRLFIAHAENNVPIYLIDKAIVDALSYALWAGVIMLTVGVALLRRRQVSVLHGPGPAFLLLGGWMSCLHFMYYDAMLTFLPVCLLFSEPSRFLQMSFWPKPREPVPAELLPYYQPTSLAEPPPMPLLPGGRHARWVVNPLPPLLLVLLLGLTPLMIWYDPSYHFPPVDTFCLIAIWAWCGWSVWREEAKVTPAQAIGMQEKDENPYPLPVYEPEA